MTTKVSKWGNSLGLRLPKRMIELLKLKEGTEVVISNEDGKIIISPKLKDLTMDELLVGMTEEGVMEQYVKEDSLGKERFWENE